MKIAVIGDLHCTRESGPEMRQLLEGVVGSDVLLLAGDLTNLGKPEEMEVLLGEFKHLSMPILAVAGNHDFENGCMPQLAEMMHARGVTYLDGSSHRIEDTDFVGTKGFAGGFGKERLQSFGEPALKSFVMAAIEEVLRFEGALKSSTATRKVALLHYAPIRDTLLGENPEVYPFLGSSLYEEVLDTHEVDIAFHAHAHNGAPEGRTKSGISVHNVSRFVRTRDGLPPALLVDL